MNEIRKQVEVAAPVAEVWRAWTTSEGATTFFGPQANIELAVGGAYEILFDPELPKGQRGAEGLKVLSYLPEEMLSFEWSAPPEFPEERKRLTFVVVQFAALGPSRTRVTLRHLGWPEGGKWPQVMAYFERAWGIVASRLEQRFARGPIDWASA